MNKIRKVLLSVMCTLILLTNSGARIITADDNTDDEITETVSEQTTDTGDTEQGDEESPVFVVEQEDVNTADQDTESNQESDTTPEQEIIEEQEAVETTTQEEISYPQFSDFKVIDDVKITVEAQEGVFPEGAQLSVEKVALYVEQQVTEAIDQVREEEKNVVASYTFDIKVLDKDGNEVQPKDMSKVKVSFEMIEVQDNNLTTDVYHIDDKQSEITAEQVTQLETVTEEKVVSVETDGFSLYTVEFTYKNKQYVLQGNSAIKLNELLANVELTGNVESWEISNTELFNIFKGTSQGISYRYSNIEDEAIEAYGIPTDNPDGDTLWMVALKLFTTNEWLKIKIDGVEYQIDVTDSYTDPLTNNDLSDRVIQDGDINNFTSSMPLATIFIDEDIINMDLWKNPNYNNIIFPEILYQGTDATFNIINQDNYEYPVNIANGVEVGRNNIDYPTQDTSTFDGFSIHEFVLEDATIKANQDNIFSGDIMRYTIQNAAEYTGSDGVTRKGNVVITFSNLNLVIEGNHSDITLQQGYPITLWDTNKFFAGITTAHGNTRLGVIVDVNVKVVDQSGQLVDGTFLYPVVDIDIDRSTNVNFGRLYDASNYRNYSEQIELTGGYTDKIWIPNSFVEGITTSDGTQTGNLRIYPTTNDNNTFNSGFITLADNTSGGINTKIISDSAISSPNAYNGVESYILTGSSHVNIKVAESTDEGGTIKASSKDYSEDIGADGINRKKIITAAKGQTVQFTMTPNPGYKIKNIYVSNSDLDILDDVQGSGATPISMSDPNLVEMPGGIYYYFMESIQNEQSIHVEWEPSKLEVTKTVTNASDIPSADFDFRLSLEIPDTTGAAKAYVKVYNTHPVPATYRMNHDFLLYDAENDVYLGYDGTGWLRDLDSSDLINTTASNITDEYWWYVEEIESVDPQTGEQIFIPVIFDKVTDDFMVYDLTTKEINMVSTMPNNAGYVYPLSSGTNIPSISWNGSAYLYNEGSILPSGYSPVAWYKMEEYEAGNYTVTLSNGTTQAVSEIESYLSTNNIPYERYEYTLSSDENDIDDVDDLVTAWNNRQKQNDAQVVSIKANITATQAAIDALDPTDPDFETDLAALQTQKAAYEQDLQDRLDSLPDILNKVTGNHGKYEFTLSYVNGEPIPSYTFDGVVPFGWGYKIEELDAHGNVVNLTNDFEADDSGIVWKLDNIIGEDIGVLNADKSVEFVNDAKKHSITITKNTVEQTSETFNFQIKAYIDGLPRIYYDFSDQGATPKDSHFYQFSLANGQSKTFVDIPVGYTYEIHELTKEGWKLVNISTETSSEYTLNEAGRYKVEVEDLDLTNVTVTTEDNINVYYKSYTVTNNDTGESSSTKEIIARTAADDALLQQYFPAYQSILDPSRYAVTATSTETTLGNRVFVNAHTTDNGGTAYHSGNVNATSTSTTSQAVPGIRGKDPITFGTLSYSSTGSVQTNLNGVTKTPDNGGTSGFNFQGQTDGGVNYMRLRYNTDGKTNQFTSSNHAVSYGDSFKFAYPGAATLEDGTVADVFVELSDIVISTPYNSMNMNFKGSIYRMDGEPAFALKSLGTATPREYTVNAKVKVTVDGATEHDTYKVTFDGTDYSGDGANPVEFNASVTNTDSSSWVIEPITLSGGDYEAGIPGTPSYTNTTVTSSPFLLTVRQAVQQQVATLIDTDTYEVNLPAGASITIPDGKTYKIYKDDGNGGWTLIRSSSDSATSVDNPAVPMTLDILKNDVEVEFTNDIKKHDLTISKETVNNDNGTFNFEVKVWGEKTILADTVSALGGFNDDTTADLTHANADVLKNFFGTNAESYNTDFYLYSNSTKVKTLNYETSAWNGSNIFSHDTWVIKDNWITNDSGSFDHAWSVGDMFSFRADEYLSSDGQTFTLDKTAKYTFTLANGDTATIPDILYGYNYEVYEVDSSGNKVLVGSNIGSTDWKLKSITGDSNTGTITDDTYVTFTNELLHDLTIRKETTDNVSGSFNFKIKAWLGETGAEEYVDMSAQLGSPDSNGYYSFTIANNRSKTITDLPHGAKYEVYEETQSGWQLINIDVFDSTVSKGAGGTSGILNSDASHTFNNMPLYDLKVTKKVAGNMGNKSKEFEFTVKILSEKDISVSQSFFTYSSDNRINSDNRIYNDLPISNVSKIEINISDLEFNLDGNTDNDWVAVGDVNTTISIDDMTYYDNSQQDSICYTYPIFTDLNNLYFDTLYFAACSDFSQIGFNTIEASSGLCFSDGWQCGWKGNINIKLYSALDLSEYGGISNGDGSYTFTLSHNDYFEIPDIPYGYEYEVTEVDYSSEGYKTKIDNVERRTISGIMDSDKDHTVTNTNGAVVPTEIRINNFILPGLIGIALICIYYIIKIKKKLRAQAD